LSAEITVADHFAHFLAENNVANVYELSGGMIAFLTDSIYRLGKTKIVNTRNEQAAGFAAEGSSRVSSIPSVAMGTSGPGATNLITAIGSAYFDSTPVLFVTGQVHTLELRTNSLQRQNGFQELDIVSATKGITKFSYQIRSADEFPEVLQRAWETAISGRQGPVLIDVPINIQQQMCKVLNSPVTSEINAGTNFLDSLSHLISKLSTAQRPLILAGGGIRSSNSQKKFQDFVEKLGLPVVHTLMGKDVLPTQHSMNMGFIGSYGNRWANRALSRSDLLIVLGSRLDVRQTGNDVEDFMLNKFIVRVDVDSNELSGRISSDISIEVDLKAFFEVIQIQSIPKLNIEEFIEEIRADKIKFTPASEQEVSLHQSPDRVITWISSVSKESAGFCVDVGQHQMWAAQSIDLKENQRFLTSGGMGAMGFSIPAAIGCATTNPKRWITITGDGCMQLNLGELQTIVHYELPITIFVLNNNQHGMVAQFQEENMDSRFISTREGYSTPNFCEVARSFGIRSFSIKTDADFDFVSHALTEIDHGPILIEVEMDNRAKALPKIDRFTKLSQL
jgi:acetolactate synthase-1/2/3 large subunit